MNLKDKTHYQTDIANTIFKRYVSGANYEELLKINESYLNEISKVKQIDKRVYNLVKIIMEDSGNK